MRWPMSSTEGAQLTLGTAGHIDHGKTALIKALTGVDTDRLAEERRRGISIELGFARLELGDGRALSVVDVPGHERLIRTMVAGASGIDLFLLAVAADDGVMPQTREHLSVLRALGVERGVVALTKCDLADDQTRKVALDEIGELLPGTPAVSVSARTGSGIDELRALLGKVAEQECLAAGEPGWPQAAVLHVDRAFSLHGIGVVVTGTLDGGAVAVGARVDVLPRGVEARVRSIQVHDEAVARALPGQRTALNLAAVRLREVKRGDVITAPGAGLRASYRLDVELRLEAGAGDLDHERVQVHHGTRDSPARVVRLDDDNRFAQLRLESPLLTRASDRLVLRRIAPPDTLGGAEVVDPAPRRHGPGGAAARLALICDGSPRELLLAVLEQGAVPADPARWDGHPDIAAALGRYPRGAWERAVANLCDEGLVVTRDGRLRHRGDQTDVPARRPTAPPALGPRELRALELLQADGIAPRPPADLAAALEIERGEAVAALELLVAAGKATRAGQGIYYEKAELDRLSDRVIGLAADRGGSISLAELRDELDTSRKYAQALLEHLDAEKSMVRHGDRHHLRRSPPPLRSAPMGRQGSGGPPGLQSQ